MDLFGFRNRLSAAQKSRMKRALRLGVSLLPHRRSLNLLALKHGTDKWGHGYMRHYREVLDPLRNRDIRLLEIGIGEPGDPRRGGGSLRMWKDFFPHGRIYGIDIEDKSCLEEDRIETFRGDQSDVDFLNEVVGRIGAPDVVIDDGSHVNAHVITSFRTLFPHLRSGGVYVIEDTQTSYWPQFGGDAEDLDGAATSMALLKQLTDGLNHVYIPDRVPGYTDLNVAAVRFFRNIAFVIKGDNRHTPTTFVRQHIEEAKRRSRESR